MRILISILISAAACLAQRPEDEVTAVLKQMERAEQSGDADALAKLFARDSSIDIEKMRPYIRPRPEARYTPTRVYTQNDLAAILARAGADNFVAMKLVKENGAWKIKDQSWSNVALQPDLVYAMVPPPDGAFARAGSPWQSIAPALDAAGAQRQGWQMRTTFDESYLYIRLESPKPLPAPGSEVKGDAAQRIDTGVPGFLVMRIDTADPAPREYVMTAGANIGDRATFDKQGKANSHFHYLSYSMRLDQKDKQIFEASADLKTSPLVSVSDRFFEIRIPLRSLGIADAARARIVVGDASWPKSAIVSVAARRFP